METKILDSNPLKQQDNIKRLEIENHKSLTRII